jgi:hypothetical protein
LTITVLGPHNPEASRNAKLRAHSGNIQGPSREHSELIQGTFKAHSLNIEGPFM